MKDYIKEFGDDQEGKKFIPAKFEPDVNQPPVQEPFRNEETISIREMRELATDLVLEFINADIQRPTTYELLEEQRNEVEQRIKKYCKRPGILSLSYHDNFELNEASVNAVIDPTNTKNWVLLKEEQIYKLPYSYKTALHAFASEVWQKNRI